MGWMSTSIVYCSQPSQSLWMWPYIAFKSSASFILSSPTKQIHHPAIDFSRYGYQVFDGKKFPAVGRTWGEDHSNR
jgi:hypothetical protein